MVALDPPVIAAPGPQAPDVIEIIGTRSDQVQKIDRRTYRVQQTPHSAQKDSLELLRGLPAVTVSANSDIMLLGSGGVTIFVDGRPYRGDSKQYLRTLHGSDIERIEIITNPSAQYSAEGTGGIINFVLRTKHLDGLSANASAEASRLGHGNADTSVKFKNGRWTYEVEAHGWAGPSGRSTRAWTHKL